MGCFSYLCKECGEPINSDSFSGEHCHIFFLVDGEVVEEMCGEYDSYGRVFSHGGDSFKWLYTDWSEMVDIHFNNDPHSGFAAIHSNCYIGAEPKTISDNDPDQGWGGYEVDLGRSVARHSVYTIESGA